MNVVIYTRVSSTSKRQSNDRQVADLEEYATRRNYSVSKVFLEKISGRKKKQDREIFSQCVDFCINSDNQIDMLLITEISRLGRSTLDILKSLEELHAQNVNVFIHNINTETLLPDGRVNPVTSIITTILAELASIEWQCIADRLHSGRQLYIKNGGKLGRKEGSVKSKEQKREEYKEVISLLKKDYSIRNIAKLTNVSISTVQRIKKEFGFDNKNIDKI